MLVKKYKKVSDFFSSIEQETVDRYISYWKTIIPTNDQQYFNCWLFAFLSVHTTWQRNVSSYKLLTSVDLKSKEELELLIKGAGVGLHTVRSKGIWKFYNDFWSDPKWWYKQEKESWVEFRERAMDRLFGIAEAKTSFAVELAHPENCRVVCLDTHMLQLYGCASHISYEKYKRCEKHWLAQCDDHGIPSPIARHIYWDRIQKQPDTKYWSHVFETNVPESLIKTNKVTNE